MGDRFRRRRRGHRRIAGLAVAAAVGVLALLAVVVAIGLHEPFVDAYFAASFLLLPASWHDEWQALPGIAHLAIAGIGVAAVVGAAGELLD